MATYLAPSIAEIQEAINNGRLKPRWIQHTGIFTPEKKTPMIVSRKGQKCRITLVPGYIYIPDRTRQIYSRHRDLFAAIRSRKHTTKGYGARMIEGEIPQLSLIIYILVKILARLQISGRLSQQEKEEIQQKLVDQAEKLQRVMDSLKRRVAAKLARGLLGSIARVNPLIAQNHLRTARNLLEERLNNIGVIVPYTERQRSALTLEVEALKRKNNSARGALEVALKFITAPYVEERLMVVAEGLSAIDLYPVKYRVQWAKVFVKKARVAIIGKDFPTAEKYLRRALGYLRWKYENLEDE